MSTLPEGWTDDMRISIDPQRINDLVHFLFDGHVRYADWVLMCERIVQEFGLTEEDAYLAIDRVQSGMVRAVTGNPENRPDAIKDPLAHMSFQRIWDELPRRHIFSRRRNAAGKWAEWFEIGQRRMRERQAESTSEQDGGGQPATRPESK